MGLEPAARAAQQVLAGKARRRAALASLSVEEKVQLLIRLQHLASAVVAASGRQARAPWQIDTGHDPASTPREP